MDKYDLHCHSYYSDGSLSPKQLIDLACENDITHLALTDHDTLSGIADAKAAALSAPSQIQLINGVELSCNLDSMLLHIVGLNIDPENAELRAGVARSSKIRKDRAELMFTKFEEMDIDLRELVHNQLDDRSVPTRPHFARALIELGLAKNMQQAFTRYLKKGKPGYAPTEWPKVDEIASWIKKAKGVAVLAHPLRYGLSRAKLVRLIKKLKLVDIYGIEVSTASTNPQQQEMLSRIAVEHNLYASIGSDFHSFEQSWAMLGSSKPFSTKLNPVWNQF